MNGLLAVWLIFHLASKSLNAAPSIEACPPDSVLSEDGCVCNTDFCVKPPCLSDLEVSVNGSDVPGFCCPVYSCEGCRNDTLIDGKCPCAPGAVLNGRGVCECIDKERDLVDGECVCNPQQCELPHICDRKSVLTTIEDGCCRKTRCLPCPEDSESTNLESDDLEDHCVCLPCKNDCGFNKTVVIKKRGTGFPGNCCDLYECKPLDEKDIDCVVGDIIYADGEEWSTDDKQECKCQNGLSLCTRQEEEIAPLNCLDDGGIYKHNETWLRDHGCTNCTCVNGEAKCISHYCDFKESQINRNNSSQPCFKDNKVFEHLQTWTEADECTTCTCLNGEEKCDSKVCEDKEAPNKKGECQPLFNCNRVCPNGFRINKKGCEICKCNAAKVGQELLAKYNITMNDLINILEDYRNGGTKNSASTTATATTTTTMPTVLIIRRNEGNSSRPETVITPAYLPKTDSSCWIIIAALAALLVGTAAGMGAVCLYKNKKKHSMDVTPSRGSYHSVSNTADNNNTIKKNVRYD